MCAVCHMQRCSRACASSEALSRALWREWLGCARDGVRAGAKGPFLCAGGHASRCQSRYWRRQGMVPGLRAAGRQAQEGQAGSGPRCADTGSLGASASAKNVCGHAMCVRIEQKKARKMNKNTILILTSYRGGPPVSGGGSAEASHTSVT